MIPVSQQLAKSPQLRILTILLPTCPYRPGSRTSTWFSSSLTDATARLHDGMVLAVDGTVGTVTVVS